MFKVISSPPKETLAEKRKRMNKHYRRCFDNACDKLNIRQMVFFGVRFLKTVDLKELDYEETRDVFSLFCAIDDLIEKLSFYTIINIFPIRKDFDGARWEAKDYFSTMDYLKDKDLSKMILEYGIDDFFWNYYNQDIMSYCVQKYMVVDRLRRFEGKEGMIEGFARRRGVNMLHKFQEGVFIDEKGNVYKEQKPKRKVPPYLKPLN